MHLVFNIFLTVYLNFNEVLSDLVLKSYDMTSVIKNHMKSCTKLCKIQR